MSKDEVRATIPAFHPVWAEVDTALIDAMDKQAAHGSFRNWANITTHILSGMKKLNLRQVDEDLVQLGLQQDRRHVVTIGGPPPVTVIHDKDDHPPGRPPRMPHTTPPWIV